MADVNQTLLGETQANSYCLKFPKTGDINNNLITINNNLITTLRDISAVVII